MLTLVSEDIERYAVDHTTPLPDYLQELTDYTYENMSIPQMLSGPIEGTLAPDPRMGNRSDARP